MLWQTILIDFIPIKNQTLKEITNKIDFFFARAFMVSGWPKKTKNCYFYLFFVTQESILEKEQQIYKTDNIIGL